MVNTQTRSAIHIILHPNQPPQVQPLSFNPEPNVHPFLPSQTLYLNQTATSLSQPMRHSTSSAPTTPPDDLVDNWDLLVADDIEGVFPKPDCRVFDNNSNDGREYKWGDIVILNQL